jgi:hypothetical protein
MNTQTYPYLHFALSKVGLGTPQQALKSAIVSWLLIALVGQWLFALYVLVQYGQPVFSGAPEQADFSHAITGYVAGDGLGNTMLFVHVIPAAIISIGGIFQLVPFIRKRFPTFHRWNGRLFLTFGLTGALTGLYLTWVRDSRLSDIGAIGITLNGMLIPIAVALAWHYARKRRFDLHQRWAVHAFLLINGVWTFRLYLMAWYLINQGSNGNTSTLDGPADIALSFACYLLPMLIAELVFWAQRQPQKSRKALVAAIMFIGAGITLLGVTGASMMMWFPRIL